MDHKFGLVLQVKKSLDLFNFAPTPLYSGHVTFNHPNARHFCVKMCHITFSKLSLRGTKQREDTINIDTLP